MYVYNVLFTNLYKDRVLGRIRIFIGSCSRYSIRIYMNSFRNDYVNCNESGVFPRLILSHITFLLRLLCIDTTIHEHVNKLFTKI